jgi:hypothetical protein
MARGSGQAERWVERRQQWRERLAAWRKSGETQAAFCRARGLDQHSLSYWKRRLGAPVEGGERRSARGGQPRASGVFVPLTVRPAASTSAAPVFEIVLRNGRVLRAGMNTEPARLSALAAALEG